jgi:hypothetical protein
MEKKRIGDLLKDEGVSAIRRSASPFWNSAPPRNGSGTS